MLFLCRVAVLVAFFFLSRLVDISHWSHMLFSPDDTNTWTIINNSVRWSVCMCYLRGSSKCQCQTTHTHTVYSNEYIYWMKWKSHLSISFCRSVGRSVRLMENDVFFSYPVYASNRIETAAVTMHLLKWIDPLPFAEGDSSWAHRPKSIRILPHISMICVLLW